MNEKVTNLSQKLKAVLFSLLKFLVRPLIGTGIGRIPIIKTLFHRLLVAFADKTITVNGFKMLLCQEFWDTFADKAIDFFKYGKFEHEPYASMLFKRELMKSSTIVDIGANIGYFTLLASSLLGNRGKAYAFEPDIINYELLLKNIKLNNYKNIIPTQCAISNNNGKTLLFQYKNRGWHSLFNAHRNPINSILVDTVTLDDFFRDGDISIDIVKIDVEGAEILVLQGMKQIIEKNDNIKIFIEFNPGCLQNAGFTTIEFWNQLVTLGFKYIYLIDEVDHTIKQVDHKAAIDYSNMKAEQSSFFNLLCTKTAYK